MLPKSKACSITQCLTHAWPLSLWWFVQFGVGGGLRFTCSYSLKRSVMTHIVEARPYNGRLLGACLPLAAFLSKALGFGSCRCGREERLTSSEVGKGMALLSRPLFGVAFRHSSGQHTGVQGRQPTW